MLKDLKVTLDALKKIGAVQHANLFEKLLRKEEEQLERSLKPTPIQTLSEEVLREKEKFDQFMHKMFTRIPEEKSEDNS